MARAPLRPRVALALATEILAQEAHPAPVEDASPDPPAEARRVLSLPQSVKPELQAGHSSALRKCVTALKVDGGQGLGVVEQCLISALDEVSWYKEAHDELVDLASRLIRIISEPTAGGHPSQAHACQRMLEMCASHKPSVQAILDLIADAIGDTLGALAGVPALGACDDDSLSRCALTSAHLFDAMEAIASHEGMPTPGTSVHWRKVLEDLHQRMSSQGSGHPMLSPLFALLQGSLTQCAWIAVGGVDAPDNAERGR